MVKRIRSEDTPEYNTEERKRIREQTIINILGQDRYNEIKEQHQKHLETMATKKDTTTTTLTPSEIGKQVVKVIMTKGNKKSSINTFRKTMDFEQFKTFLETLNEIMSEVLNEQQTILDELKLKFPKKEKK